MTGRHSALVWEQTDDDVRLCDWPRCRQEALHRAPYSRHQMNSYRWFCLSHIRIYNASWNYYGGMSEEEVEADIRNDTVWGRPSWPFGAAIGVVSGHFGDDFELFDDDGCAEDEKSSAPHHIALSASEAKAMIILDLKPPISIISLKARYKELVKRYHPDVTGGDKASEEKFKQINHAYHTIADLLPS